MVIDNQDVHSQKLDHVGGRVSAVESKAARQGMITGAIAAIGISFIKEKLGL
jgi:hypothetical protein